MTNTKAIINGRVITPDWGGSFAVKENHALLFDEKIKAIMPMNLFDGDFAAEIFDAHGDYVSPGFINTHIHGSCGFDAMDGTTEALQAMQRFQAKTGVTAMLPTTMTMTTEKIFAALYNIRRVAEDGGVGARILGANVEGPFISEKYCGAQDKKNIMPADLGLFSDFADIIKIITFAPETLDAKARENFIKNCRRHNIIPSIGHTAADCDTALQAVALGATRFTHVYNGMSGVHHRHGGAALAALAADEADAEIIADNVHSCGAAQKLLYRGKDGKHIVLVTDSMRACGMGEGESELGGQKVFVKGNVAALADGTIAGSIITMDKSVKIFADNVGLPIEKAVECASKNPALSVNVYHDLGSLEVGKQADIILFDENVTVKMVFIGGKSYD